MRCIAVSRWSLHPGHLPHPGHHHPGRHWHDGWVEAGREDGDAIALGPAAPLVALLTGALLGGVAGGTAGGVYSCKVGLGVLLGGFIVIARRYRPMMEP